MTYKEEIIEIALKKVERLRKLSNAAWEIACINGRVNSPLLFKKAFDPYLEIQKSYIEARKEWEILIK